MNIISNTRRWHRYFLTYISYIPRAYRYQRWLIFIISDLILNALDISCHHLYIDLYLKIIICPTTIFSGPDCQMQVTLSGSCFISSHIYIHKFFLQNLWKVRVIKQKWKKLQKKLYSACAFSARRSSFFEIGTCVPPVCCVESGIILFNLPKS